MLIFLTSYYYVGLFLSNLTYLLNKFLFPTNEFVVFMSHYNY